MNGFVEERIDTIERTILDPYLHQQMFSLDFKVSSYTSLVQTAFTKSIVTPIVKPCMCASWRMWFQVSPLSEHTCVHHGECDSRSHHSQSIHVCIMENVISGLTIVRAYMCDHGKCDFSSHNYKSDHTCVHHGECDFRSYHSQSIHVCIMENVIPGLTIVGAYMCASWRMWFQVSP